jgi:hypothetical protein
MFSSYLNREDISTGCAVECESFVTISIMSEVVLLKCFSEYDIVSVPINVTGRMGTERLQTKIIFKRDYC